MKVAVVGAGVLGLTLAHRLVGLGHQVSIFEAQDRLGGLACAHDYGSFTWDRFYHCILPQDARLIALLGELGLEDELEWAKTGTGYYAPGRTFDMSNNRDYLRFPLLNLVDKGRLGFAMLYATRVRDPYRLYCLTARDWLIQMCGQRTYEIFWQPMLKAKFGSFHDQVAAVFIWATLTRLFGARSKATNAEQLGYVRGGYGRIFERFEERLRAAGASLHVSTRIERIESAAEAGQAPAAGQELVVEHRAAGAQPVREHFDQLFFTAPTGLARGIVSPELATHVDDMATAHPTSDHYLGVLCGVLAVKRPLTPYYVLNIGDGSVELTGLIEMTNLIDRERETAGASLIYLPRYLASDDPAFEASDAEVEAGLLDRGLKRLFPDFDDADVLYRGVHRARYVQPLPLVRDEAPRPSPPEPLRRPFQILNTSMLECGTLNNDEVVGLVDAFVERNRAVLTEPS